MFSSFSKIATGVDIIIFMWAVSELVCHLTNRKSRNNDRIYLYSAVIGLMIAWRILIGISTARYSTGLILPFAVIAAYFFPEAFRKRHILVRLLLCIYIGVTGIIIMKMNCDAWSKSHFCFNLAESFDYLDQSGKDYMFRTYSSHFNRIERLTNLLGDHVSILETKINKDIVDPDRAYVKPIINETVLNIPTGVLSNDVAVYSHMKLIVHLVANPAGTKKQYVYTMNADDDGDALVSGILRPLPRTTETRRLYDLSEEPAPQPANYNPIGFVPGTKKLLTPKGEL